MLTIYAVPLSVHTRKTIITALHKDIEYKFEVVIPVVPGQPPSNWAMLSPTGLIPVIRDGDYTLADSTAISLYLEKKRPSPSLLPSDVPQYGRALWFDAYAGGTLFRHVVHPLFYQSVVSPGINKIPTDKTAVEKVLTEVAPKIFRIFGVADRREVPRRRLADTGRCHNRLELPRLSILRLYD